MALTKVDKTLLETTGTASASTFLRGDGTWNAPASSGFIGYTVYTGGATWTKTDNNPTKLVVEVQGAGGGGGGGSTSKGDGGGGGGYARKFLDVTNIDTATIVIGSAGTGGASTANGVAGGLSSFVKAIGSGSFADIIGNGGALGQTNNLGGGTGGSGAGGDFNIKGGSGGGQTNENNIGGGSQFSSMHYSITGGANPPTATPGYGGGGEGSRGTTGYSGAAGTAGVVIVWEYK
jgi:hypothetical protein